MRHAEIGIPITALRPPAKFELLRLEAEAAEADGLDRSAVAGRQVKEVVWRVPAGARQEALGAIARDAREGINAS